MKRHTIVVPIGRVLPRFALLTLLADLSCVGDAFIVAPLQTMKRGVAATERLPSTLHSNSLDQQQLYWLEPSLSSSSSSSANGYGWDDDDDILFGGDLDEEDNNDDDPNDDGTTSLGCAIGEGKVVICLPDVASPEECQALYQAGLQATQRQATITGGPSRGRSRFSVADPTAFDSNIVFTVEQILLRVLDYIDESIPSIYTWLFDPTLNPDLWMKRQPLNAMLEQPDTPPDTFLGEMCSGLRDLYMMGALEWSEGEPAINIYTFSGYFGCHKDHLALTILIPLTNAGEDFDGGGTGFWAGNRAVDENPVQTEPDLVLTPTMGSALLFGGDVTHAGMSVERGCRGVLVCSLSTRTPASSPDRLHGLQAPPRVSANFKGTA